MEKSHRELDLLNFVLQPFELTIILVEFDIMAQ